MTLKSMTGFGRADGAHGSSRWHWELRSVNGRGLDIRLRVPPGFDAVEAPAREMVARRMGRGNVTLSLNVQRGEGTTELRLNAAALAQVLAAVAEVRRHVEAPPPAIDGLLAIRGVLEVVEPVESEVDAEARHKALLQGLEQALGDMIRSREGEGARLGAVIVEQLATIERLVSAVEASPARTIEAIATRLREQVGRLLEAAAPSAAIDTGRLYQEAAILATKVDVEEELARLRAHVAAARELLHAAEPVGRRFDFLTQEFNREANTLCSKVNDAPITRHGLELKAVIDQMREQVQNIE